MQKEVMMHALITAKRSTAICFAFSPDDRRVMMESLFQDLHDVDQRLFSAIFFPFYSRYRSHSLIDLMPVSGMSGHREEEKGVRVKGGLFVNHDRCQ